MGVVYEAFDERLERRVALKVLRHDTADPSAGDRLIREARVAARVVHPLICQVYDLGDADGRPVSSRWSWSKASRSPTGWPAARLPPGDALRTAATMLDALAVLHGHGIVHRDLKPSNVFLSGDRAQAARLRAGPAGAGRRDVTGRPLTAAGMFVGTPQYASPEQLAGAHGRRPLRPVLGGGRRLRDARRPAAVRAARPCRRSPMP